MKKNYHESVLSKMALKRVLFRFDQRSAHKAWTIYSAAPCVQNFSRRKKYFQEEARNFAVVKRTGSERKSFEGAETRWKIIKAVAGDSLASVQPDDARGQRTSGIWEEKTQHLCKTNFWRVAAAWREIRFIQLEGLYIMKNKRSLSFFTCFSF